MNVSRQTATLVAPIAVVLLSNLRCINEAVNQNTYFSTKARAVVRPVIVCTICDYEQRDEQRRLGSRTAGEAEDHGDDARYPNEEDNQSQHGQESHA